MSAKSSERSPLSARVLFLVCLGIAGSVLAGLQYVAVDLPQQERSLSQPPTNSVVETACYQTCLQYADATTCVNKCQSYK